MYFDKEEAIKYGVEEAIMIDHLRKLILDRKNKGKNFIDGHYWVYMTLRDFEEELKFWSVKQIRRILTSLKTENVIKVGQFNKENYDKTNWFTFINEEEMLSKEEKEAVIVKVINPIKETKRKKALKKASRPTFVKPTIEEIEEFCKERNNKVDAKRFFDYYDIGDWRDGKGKPIKSWKQKLIAVWERNTSTVTCRDTEKTNSKAPEPAKSIEDYLPPGYSYRDWLAKGVELKRLPQSELDKYDAKVKERGW